MTSKVSEASTPEFTSESGSAVATLLVGHYRSSGQERYDQDLREFLARFSQHNCVGLKLVGYRYRDEAIEALSREEIQYLYDPDWVRKEGSSNGGILLMALLTPVCVGLFVLFGLFAGAAGVEDSRDGQFLSSVLALLFACGGFFATRSGYKTIRRKSGEKAEIEQHPLVLRRSATAPVLNAQPTRPPDQLSAFR